METAERQITVTELLSPGAGRAAGRTGRGLLGQRLPPAGRQGPGPRGLDARWTPGAMADGYQLWAPSPLDESLSWLRGTPPPPPPAASAHPFPLGLCPLMLLAFQGGPLSPHSEDGCSPPVPGQPLLSTTARARE